MDYRDWRQLLTLVPQQAEGYTSRRARGVCDELWASGLRPLRHRAATPESRAALPCLTPAARRITGRR
jgi:hypothetical protein